jgi:hypothetical protein
MSKSDAMLKGMERVGFDWSLQPGWFDVIEAALAEDGYYIAPVIPATTTGSRTTDPRTSHAAAESIKVRAGTQRARLLETFGRWPDDGLTDEQAMERSQGVRADSEYAKRCSELRAAGLIRDTGRDRKGGSGLDRIVSEITEAGKAALRGLEGS